MKRLIHEADLGHKMHPPKNPFRKQNMISYIINFKSTIYFEQASWYLGLLQLSSQQYLLSVSEIELRIPSAKQ